MVKGDRKNIRQKTHPLARAAGTQSLFYLTDTERYPDYTAVIAALPVGSFIIFRDYDHENREEKARTISNLAKKRSLYFLVAGDIRLARRVKAHGIHVPEHMLYHLPVYKRLGFTFISAACHNRLAVERASAIGVDFMLVSPVFRTASHPGATGLGVHHLSRLLCGVRGRVVALGGISYKTARALRGVGGIDGVAAISGLHA